jgi:hypothetical protein
MPNTTQHNAAPQTAAPTIRFSPNNPTPARRNITAAKAQRKRTMFATVSAIRKIDKLSGRYIDLDQSGGGTQLRNDRLASQTRFLDSLGREGFQPRFLFGCRRRIDAREHGAPNSAVSSR